MNDKPVEYEFILPDDSKRYEIIYHPSDVNIFKRIHKVVVARPVKRKENDTM